tara:strand:- start:160 stop:606 length:447 start_codon:yes stop_codon:yes gene_type:complete
MNPIKKEKLIHDKLLEYIGKNSRGMTMTELVKVTGFSRKAIEKHLEILILENEIYMKRFGVTKVYYPHRKIQHFDFEKFSYNNKTIWFDVLEGEFGKYLLIQKKKKVDDKWIHEHSITIPLDQAEKFSDVLKKLLGSSKTKKLLDDSK